MADKIIALNSIVKWRKMYFAEGLESLLNIGRVGGIKKSVISAEELKCSLKYINTIR